MDIREQSPQVVQSLQGRLRRVEGQVRGVQKMLDEGRDCVEVIQQLNAIQAAVQNAADLYLRAHAKDCLLRLGDADAQTRDATVDKLLDLMARAR